MKPEDAMFSITVVDSKSSVREVARLMRDKNIGSVLVSVGGEIKGIITTRDMTNRVVATGLDIDKTTAGDIMSTPLITIDAEDDIEKAIEMFNERRIRRIPVVKKGMVVGILTQRGLMKKMPYFYLRRKKERDEAVQGGDW
ncbi:MAG: CBS domain-containing protein [Candidatus Micrarchaeia archaeon]